MNVRAVAAFVFALGMTGPSSASSTTLTGKMSMYNYLLAGTWMCKAAGSVYAAKFNVVPENRLHGYLYYPQGAEDSFYGYSASTRRYFTVSADSNGATESQTSADGATYTGTLSDGKTMSTATKIMTMVGPNRWTVRAKGTAGGQKYDFLVTCDRR